MCMTCWGQYISNILKQHATQTWNCVYCDGYTIQQMYTMVNIQVVCYAKLREWTWTTEHYYMKNTNNSNIMLLYLNILLH
jgi:hypothetical protein